MIGLLMHCNTNFSLFYLDIGWNVVAIIMLKQPPTLRYCAHERTLNLTAVVVKSC